AALTVSAGKIFTITANITPTSMSVTATEDANPSNTATIDTANPTYSSVASTYGSNTRFGLFKGGRVAGTVNFGQVQAWSSLGLPAVPAAPTRFTLLSVSDTFTDPNGTLITAHTAAPTNLSGSAWRQFLTGGDGNDAHDIQSNQLRLRGSRDVGNFATLDQVLAPDGGLFQIDGTFDASNGCSFAIGPQAKQTGSYSLSVPQ